MMQRAIKQTRIFLFFSLLAASRLAAQLTVDAVLESYKADKDLKNAAFSFCVVEAQSGKILKDYNADASLVPASTLKVLTTSAALGILGKNYTYKTKVYFSQKLDSVKGVLNGDIIVKGSGDPSLNSEYFYKSNILLTWIDKLTAGGLKSVTGRIYGDDSYFDNHIPSTWIWGDMGNYFGAGANGLSFSDNKFVVTLESSGAGKKAKLNSVLTKQGEPLYNDHFTTADSVVAGGKDDNAYIYGAPGISTKTISGTIPPDQQAYEVEGAMSDPGQELCHELYDHLAARVDMGHQKPGDLWISKRVMPADYGHFTLAYTHVSPTLDKIVYYTNTKSDNHYAESLLNTIGAVKSGRQGTTGNGIEAVTNYWKGRGVDLSGLFMVDGSGLSRANGITTKIQATILSKIYRDSLVYPTFNASLPVAGRNGSMSNLCKGTFAENNMRAKTGYITRARGYCGYVKTKSGKELAFSVLFNNYACSPKEMKLKIEQLLVALTEL